MVDSESTLVVMGQGYVGLPLALRAVQRGFRTFGFDIDAGLLAGLRSGVSHIDDVTDEELASALANGYQPTDDPAVIETADVVVVCVPTPLLEGGGPDLAAVRSAAATIGEHVRQGALVVLESTTYPGTTEEVFAPLVAGEHVVGDEIFVAFSPERIDPGNTTYGIQNTPKVVGGLTTVCGDRAEDFYAKLVDTVVRAKGAREAEMAKLIENTFRHVNIALVNEMLRFSHELDVDLWDAIDCAETKPFGFMAFRPGPGVGGHCIPVDPSYLSHRVRARLGYSFRLVELAQEINSAAPMYVAERVREALNDRLLAVKKASVLLLGVTYKPDIADCRESPADAVARRLLSWGANLSYHDPYVATWRPHPGSNEHLIPALEREVDPYSAAAKADITVLLQPHSSYDLGSLADRSSCLLDARGVLPVSAPSVIRL